MITAAQKATIDAVVSLHETGKLPSPAAYSTVIILPDGGGISYGKHQSTDHSGSLDAIVMRYIDLGGALATQMLPYLALLKADFSTKVDPKNPPANVAALEALLAKAGAEAKMQMAQDQVFDEGYWTPTLQKCAAMGLTTALAHLVVYDTCIQSGPGRVDSLRQNFPERPPATGGSEQAWVKAFVTARKAWLLSSSNPIVRQSVYRCDALLGLVSAGNWNLVTPFVYRGVTVR